METNGLVAGQDNGMPSPGLTSSMDAGVNPVQMPEKPQERVERTFKQADVNEIVKRAKASAVDDFRRLQSEQPDYARQKYGESIAREQNVSVPHESVERIVTDRMQQIRDDWAAQEQEKLRNQHADRVINTFWQKVNPARANYSDFDQVASNMGLQKFPGVIELLADHVDNSGDVLYALGKDMAKLATLESWIKNDYGHIAIAEIKKLAQSIKDNDQASKMRQPNEPLSQLRTSSSSPLDNGVLAVKDLRRKYRV